VAVSTKDFDRRVTSIAALAEPVRRALYRYVVGQPGPVGREQAAAAVGVAHHVAKFNLDKLEEEGLLEVEFARPPGRRGPGAGRPAKLYRRTSREIEVSLPERRYDLAGQVMATAIARSQQTATPISEALAAAATEAGRALGLEVRAKAGSRPSRGTTLKAVNDVLTEHGYEPQVAGKTITLANCPFHSLAQNHTDLVCGMNLDLMNGLLEGLSPGALRARLTPTPGRCCVTIEPPAGHKTETVVLRTSTNSTEGTP
jgi:predicted ArsR family transcriptional regulator